MSTQETDSSGQSIAYSIFILVLTVMSLVIMVLLLLPLNSATLGLLTAYENIICVVFLADFTLNMLHAPSKKGYFIEGRGWLDLIGSIPSFPNPIFKFAALLRLARLSRLARISRLLRGQQKKEMVEDVLKNRAQYAAFITILLGFVVLTTSSIVVLNAESRSDEANITTGWNAFWWAFVTITTVGYGDYFPVTVIGRIGGMFVMVMGVGIIGALASILASLLVGGGPSTNESEGEPAAAQPGLEGELAAVRSELASLRSLMEGLDGRLARPVARSEAADAGAENPPFGSTAPEPSPPG